MPQQHGDWKQLFRAAGEGNVVEMAYHVEHNGVDVNFQHPEYMSSVLCEAVRAGHVSAVQYLLTRGADPYQTEYFSDQLPLQLALDARRHDVVDVLLEAMTEKENDVDDDNTPKATTSISTLTETTTIVQTIWLDTNDDALVTAVANIGHCVVWTSPTPAMTTTDQTSRLARIRAVTGNRKIFVSALDHQYFFNRRRDPPIVDVVFVDNRNDNHQDHAGDDGDDGCNRPIVDRLLLLGLVLNSTVVVAGQGPDHKHQQQMLTQMNAKRLILAQQPTITSSSYQSESTTTVLQQQVMTAPGGDGTPAYRLVYEVVVPPRRHSLWWWWWWWWYPPMSSSSFVEATLAAIFPVPLRTDDNFKF